MKEGLEEFAEEIIELWGPDAWKAAMQNAYAAQQRGQHKLARNWREIAAYIDPKADTGEKEPVIPGLFKPVLRVIDGGEPGSDTGTV